MYEEFLLTQKIDWKSPIYNWINYYQIEQFVYKNFVFKNIF